MADRPFENLSMKLKEKIEKLKWNKGYHYTTPEKLMESMKSQITDIDTIDLTYLAHKDKGGRWENLLSRNSIAYSQALQYAKKWEDEQNGLLDIERKAARIALTYRFYTTLAVALTIGTVYSIAGNSDRLYLPLQQKTVTYYYEGKHHLTPPSDPSKYKEPQKVVTVTGTSKGKPMSIHSPKPFAVSVEPKL